LSSERRGARGERRGARSEGREASTDLLSRWRRYVVGNGALEPTDHTLRFVSHDASSRRYTNAQIDDYHELPRRRFPWRPPVTLTVRARFSHSAGALRGTAGFGLWNNPFVPAARQLSTLPRAVWFFYASPPSNMKLDLHAPGCGWKAATIDALRWPFFALLPAAPLAIPLMHLRAVYRRLWPLGQRAIGVSEAPLAVEMTDWHTYVIQWETKRARFFIDDAPVLDCATSPHGPLGFVMWLDNQYAVVTPWGKLGFGLLDAPGRQWMEIKELLITPGRNLDAQYPTG